MNTRILTPLVLVPMLLATAGCGMLDDDPAAQAQEALAQGDIAAARIHYAAILAENPGDHAARARFADTLIELGDGIGAQAAIDQLPEQARAAPANRLRSAHAQLIENRPDAALELLDTVRLKDGHAQAAYADWLRIGAHLAAGRTTRASELADAAIATHKNDARLLALTGEIALQARKVERAKQLAARALKADAGEITAQLLAGKIALAKGDHEAAARHYSAAVAANRSIPGPYLSLAAVQADMGRLDDAQATLDQVNEIASGHPMAMFLGAKLAFVRGDLDRAHRIMQDAENDLRKVPAAQLLQGEIAHLRGSHEQAIAFLRPFLRDNPGHVQGATVMAQAMIAAGDADAAYDTIVGPASRAVASPQTLALASRLAGMTGRKDSFADRLDGTAPPADLSARLAKANAAISRRDWKAARTIYAGLRKDGAATNALVLNNGALAALNTGNRAEALQLARQAAALTPDDPHVLDTLGWTLLQTSGDKAEALRLLSRAKATLPGNLEIRWHYAAALAANGRKDEARTIIREVRAFANADQRAHIDRLLKRL